jgi:hypothetical protein
LAIILRSGGVVYSGRPVGELFHCPSKFQISAIVAISSMHDDARGPMRFIEYSA